MAAIPLADAEVARIPLTVNTIGVFADAANDHCQSILGPALAPGRGTPKSKRVGTSTEVAVAVALTFNGSTELPPLNVAAADTLPVSEEGGTIPENVLVGTAADRVWLVLPGIARS